MKRRVLWIGLVIIMSIVAIFVVILQKPATAPQQSTPTPTNDTSKQQPQVVATMPQLLIGNPDAKITITEYGDFQCPFCKRFFEQTEPQLIREYINTGIAKIEFKVETHIGAESMRAGEAAYCANDQQAFKAYHDELYKRQKGTNAGTFNDANLQQIAADIGLDRQKFASCLQAGTYRLLVEQSNLEAKQRGVTTTPTFFIGERKIVGNQPFNIFKTIIDGQR